MQIKDNKTQNIPNESHSNLNEQQIQIPKNKIVKTDNRNSPTFKHLKAPKSYIENIKKQHERKTKMKQRQITTFCNNFLSKQHQKEEIVKKEEDLLIDINLEVLTQKAKKYEQLEDARLQEMEIMINREQTYMANKY